MVVTTQVEMHGRRRHVAALACRIAASFTGYRPYLVRRLVAGVAVRPRRELGSVPQNRRVHAARCSPPAFRLPFACGTRVSPRLRLMYRRANAGGTLNGLPLAGKGGGGGTRRAMAPFRLLHCARARPTAGRHLRRAANRRVRTRHVWPRHHGATSVYPSFTADCDTAGWIVL